MADPGSSGNVTVREAPVELTMIQVSDAVIEKRTELLLLSGLMETEVAMPEVRLPQVHREGLGQDDKRLRVLLTGSWRSNGSGDSFKT